MINIRVKFFSYEWDHYQGGYGRVIEHERVFQLSSDLTIDAAHDTILSIINNLGYTDSWHSKTFSGKGLISISLI